MSIVWILKLYGHPDVDRVYGPDLLREVCQGGLRKGYKHFLYGGGEGIAHLLSEKLQQEWPSIQIAGTHSPPFRPLSAEEDTDIISMINDSGADIVWIGLGSPQQERWMADHLAKINAPVMVGVGAAFDFLSGNKPQAPKWIRRSGMEWFFRILQEPKRLWPRYSRYPKFVFLIALQLLGLRDFTLKYHRER
jgi:N-acetylglucosaminyldiphosphoundecaprenol N-acetyl-beta-D-mannosaminyltransferase